MATSIPRCVGLLADFVMSMPRGPPSSGNLKDAAQILSLGDVSPRRYLPSKRGVDHALSSGCLRHQPTDPSPPSSSVVKEFADVARGNAVVSFPRGGT
jgi:hypothetical protein